MSTGLIIAIVVVAIILIALLVMLPRMRAAASEKKRERELAGRRKQAAGELREEADARSQRAAAAEQQARMAELEARREKAEAGLQQERASAYERGMADHELMDDEAGRRREGLTSSSETTTAGEPSATGARGDGIDSSGESGARTHAYSEGRMAAHEPQRQEDFHEGRRDEEQQDDKGGLFGRFRRRSRDREAAPRA